MVQHDLLGRGVVTQMGVKKIHREEMEKGLRKPNGKEQSNYDVIRRLEVELECSDRTIYNATDFDIRRKRRKDIFLLSHKKSDSESG